jgi:tRNA 5-methylaminomethyl-2-thiouridine biosynthesis bifunctional protein
MVVGGGLAGAGVAWRLVQDGWRVTLIEAQSHPAAGASALPFGVLAPSPPVHSRPTSVAMQWLHLAQPVAEQRLQQLLPHGQGWQRMPLRDRREPAATSACVVSPGRWVQAYVQQAAATGRLKLHLSEAVQAATQGAEHASWCLAGEHGSHWHGDVVIWANAMAAAQHVPTLAEALLPVVGQLSVGPCRDATVPEVRRDHGVWVNGFDADSQAPRYSVGATYRRGHTKTIATEVDHQTNRAKLERLNPGALPAFDEAHATNALTSWVGVRCTTAQRLPMVGALASQVRPARHRVSLGNLPRMTHALALLALGSRGLTSHALAADMIAAQLGARPCPVPPPVARALDPGRAWLKQLRSGATVV